jgi:hypothetical protein
MAKRAKAGDRTTTTRLVAAFAAIAGGTAASQAALGEDTEALAVDLADCVELQSPEERFECYESRVEAARRERAPEAAADPGASGAGVRTVVIPPAAQAPSAQRESREPARGTAQPADEVLRTGPNEETFGLSQRRPEANERTEIRATVASVRETIPQTYIIELENGQIWRQMRPRQYHLRPGHHVTIYSTNWGRAYRLSADELNGFIQVERVR